MTIAETLRQVGLLLRRNLALHLRQPVILILELLWPIMIFLVVMAARNAIPPVAQQTCYYRAWALPSAGVVPFIQSMICNIDDCQNATEYEEIPTYPGSSVRELVDNTMPLITDQSITELVSALPRGMRLIRVVVDTLSGPDLSALLGKGFPIRNLLRDTNDTRMLLLHQNLKPSEVDLLFESSMQLPQILDLMNEKTMCEFPLDGETGNISVIEKLRKSLCSSSEDSRKDFFRQLKNQLNIRSIVHTMGLAMSELGRLDISDILRSIGGLLGSVQSSDILSTDVVSLTSSILGQIRFENVDIEIISLLADDLEPLYRHSEWAGLINILKDIKLPKSQARLDRFHDSDKVFPEIADENGSKEIFLEGLAGEEMANASQNASILDTVLELARTGFDLIQLLPAKDSSHLRDGMKYFALLVEIADEITKTMKKDDSSKFIDSVSDVLGATFLNIARSPDQVKEINWCDKKEAKRLLHFSERKNIDNLQEYACRISKIMGQDSHAANVEHWDSAAEKLRRMLRTDSLFLIRKNIRKWNETEAKKSNTEVLPLGKMDSTESDKNRVEDFITAAECSVQGFKEILEPLEAKNMSTLVESSTSQLSDGKFQNLMLSYIFGAKNIAIDLKRYFFSKPGAMAPKETHNFLETMDMMMVDMEGSSMAQNVSSTMKAMQFIPTIVGIIQNFNKTTGGSLDITAFVSALVEDLEPIVWKAISRDEVRDFSVKSYSKHFCITPESLDEPKNFLRSLACQGNHSTIKISFPTKKKMKYVNSALLLNSKQFNENFNVQIFAKLLLQLTSGSGFIVKTLSQFLKPVQGCESACNTTDLLLKKMCFLSRMQNIRNFLEAPSTVDYKASLLHSSDIMMQLQPLLGLSDDIIDAYQHFIQTIEASAVNNYTNSKDIVRLIIGGVRLMESLDSSEHKMRPVLHVVISLISLLKNRVADTAQYNKTSVVEIQNVFPGSPLTQDVVRSMLPVLPDITSTIFWTALAHEELLQLVIDSSRNMSVVMSQLCNSSLSTYLYNPSLDRDRLENLGSIICRHKYFDVFEEIFQDPDIQEIVFEADNTDEIAWDDMTENIEDIISLLSYLSDVRKADLGIIPPIAKWQMMALEIYSQMKNPTVILYIINNKLFSDFCFKLTNSSSLSSRSKNGQKALYSELCSMSKESFASKLVQRLNQTVQDAVKDQNSTIGLNSVGIAVVKEKFWEALLNIPEIRNVAKMAFDVDVQDTDKIQKSEGSDLEKGRTRLSKSFIKKLMNATEKAFDMADEATDNQLSVILLGSLVPEFAQDFASLVEKSDGVISLSSSVERGSGFEKLFRYILDHDMDRRRLESYISNLSSFFSKKSNYNKLESLCRSVKQKKDAKSISFTVTTLCSLDPKSWTVRYLVHDDNFNDAWLKIDEFLGESTKNKTRGSFLMKRKMDLLSSINRTLSAGIFVPDWSTLETSSFYFNLLRSFVRNLGAEDTDKNIDLTKKLCVTKTAESAFEESVHQLLDSIPDAEFMTCGLLQRNISSFYAWISKSADVKKTVEKVSKELFGNSSCSNMGRWLTKSIDDAELLFNKLSKSLPPEAIARVNNCISNFPKSPLKLSLQAHANVMKQVSKLLTGLAVPADHWKELREQVTKKISQHLPVFLKISDVMSNQTSWLIDYDGIDRRILKESSLNFNWLLHHGFSPTSLSKKICNGESYDAMKSVFVFPSRITTAARARTKDFLCSNGTIEELLGTFDFADIKAQVLKEQEKEFFSGKWLQKLLSSSEVLVKIVEHMGSALKEVQFHNIYNIFQLFTKPQVLENLAKSMDSLMEVLSPVFSGSSLIDTLHQVMEGLRAFKSLTQLANFTFVYTVRDVFGDAALEILIKDFKYNASTAAEVLDSKIDLKQAIVSKDNGKVSFCRGPSDKSPICVLSRNKRTAITSEYLQDLVLQRFLYSFGTLGIEGILREADVDADEANKTLEILSGAPMVVSKLTNYLETVTSVLHPELKDLIGNLEERGVEWLASPKAMSIGGQILCGKPLTSLSKKFSLLAPEDTENKIEERELLRLPTDFCRYGYKEIMKMPSGAILWGFLKPLFRGKILYAPKDYRPGITIISKVNETLRMLEDHLRFVKSAAEGSTGLHYVQRKGETLLSLQKFVASKAISKLLGSVSWGSALTWLESSNSTTRSLLKLVELVGNVTECISLDRFIGFETEAELEAAAATLHDRREFIAAIVFLNKDASSARLKRGNDRIILPKEVMYKIRMDIDNVPTTEYIKYRWWRPYPYDDFFEDLRYFRGFIQLQDTIDTAITNLHSQVIQPDLPKKYLQQFPYPCHQRDKFGTLLKGSMPAVMTISWVFIVAFLVRQRVLDRELDQTLKVMGLKKSAGCLAWFLTGFCVLLVSVIGIVMVLKYGGITPLSDPVILFIFVTDFAVLLIAYCQLMSAFFSRAATAALMSVLIYVLSFFPFLLFVTWELDFLYWQKLLSCVLVSTSFCFGCLYLNRYEDQGQGVQWWNLWHSPVIEDRMNFGTTLVSMALCSLLYFFVSWCIVRVWTGTRERKPLVWYLIRITPSFSENSIEKQVTKLKSGSGRMDAAIPSKNIGITMKCVHALYSGRGSKEWKALCGLTMDFYEDHITVLLGHNGAGKTTTLKILTGNLHHNSGIVKVGGFTYPEQITEARKHIGFCPQNNTLYDKLTVKEHLYLFARLKGVLSPAQVEQDVEKMLESLNLVDKQNEPSDTLSGGQRRRLCVGIAFVGGSKVVILDEPTSSVDPVARRSIWDIILNHKKGRTILLTTHHLDEADILSDRVAILHKGRLLCCGSPLYLKNRFGSGYRLSFSSSFDKSEDQDSGHDTGSIKSEDLSNIDSDGLMDFIFTYIPEATLLENDASHLVVSLPAEPLSSKPLSPFFAHLQNSLQNWGFHSCSLSSPTLDEVFLTLCRVEDAKAAHHSSERFSEVSPFSMRRIHEASSTLKSGDSHFKGEFSNLEFESPVKKALPSQGAYFQGTNLKFSQLKSLIKKRYWHTRQNWKTLTSSIIMPCIFIALAMALAVGRPQQRPDPSIELTPSLYSTEEQKAISFFEWKYHDSIGMDILDCVKANLTQGKVCFEDHSKCSKNLVKGTSTGTGFVGGSRCLCAEECPATPLPQLPFLAADRQILYNLSSVNLPKYLLDSYLQFNEKRYGGWSVDHDIQDHPNVKVWFENSGYHSAPSYLNVLNNAVLKNVTGKEYGIRTWSHPLRLSVEQLGRETLLQRLGEVGIAFVFLIGLSLVPSTFAVYIVGERESEQKRLQMVTGHLGPILYWSASLVWDLTLVLTTSLLSAAIVAAFALPAFYDRQNFRAVNCLVFFYGWATTPLTYLLSGFFREGSLAFMVIFTSHLFVGLVIMLSLVSLRMISVTKDVAATLELVQRLSLAFPQYSLVGGLTDLNENQIRAEVFAQFGQDAYSPPLGWSALGPNLVALFLQGVFFFALTIALELIPFRRWLQSLILGVSNFHPEENVPDDTENSLLQIQNVYQVYPSKSGKKYALNGLSLNIPKGECFGLVGANGAGKTTLFRLLIGQEEPVSGRILRIGLQNKTISKHRFVGYCPQKDALDGLLTPRQHLEVYAGLRGIPAAQISKVVERSLQSLELNTHADLPVSSLSGGTKRKLCTAIAYLGDPELILLDEPTSGMDPGTRRLVWRCISRAIEAGHSVILTSHSIEDCDVLCTRLGIMVNGRIACLDSPSNLKNRLGSGYTMSFRISEGQQDWTSLLSHIHKVMPTAKLQVRSGRRIEMSLPDENITLSNLFCHLEECAQQFGIEDLAIDPTTLDQVFVNFIRQQSDATERISSHPESEIMSSLGENIKCTKL